MGSRLSFRNRVESPLQDFTVPYDAAYDAYPQFTLPRLAELLMRVRKIRVEATWPYTFTDSQDPGNIISGSGSITMDLVADAWDRQNDVIITADSYYRNAIRQGTNTAESAPYEIGYFYGREDQTYTAQQADLGFGQGGLVPEGWLRRQNDGTFRGNFLEISASALLEYTDAYSVFRSEVVSNAFRTVPSALDATLATASLAGLASGSMTFPARHLTSGTAGYAEISFGTPTLVLTATEWWPYATTAAAAAWNTATGAAANGGPGA